MANVIIGHNPIDPKDCTKYHVPDGITVSEWLGSRKFLHPTICYANGFEENAILLKAEQKSYVLRSSDTVVFVPQLQGGGGSNPLKVIIGLALIVFSGGVAGFLGGTLGATAITGGMVARFGAAVLLSAFAKPKTPETSSGDIKSASPTYSVQAQGNVSGLGSAIPKIYGRHIIYPSFIAAPWTYYHDNQQHLIQVFLVGHGRYAHETPKLEDSLISSFTRCDWAFVEYDSAGNMTVPLSGSGIGWNNWNNTYTHMMVTSSEVSGQEMLGSNEAGYGRIGPFVVNKPGTEIATLQFDLMCPRGLYYANDDGSFASKTVQWEFRAQRIDDDGVAVGDYFAITSPQTISGSSSVSRQIPQGESDVQVVMNIDLGVKNASNIKFTANTISDWLNGQASSRYAARLVGWTITVGGATDWITAVVEGYWGSDGEGYPVWCGGVQFTFDYAYTTTSSAPSLTAATNEVQQWTYSCQVPPGRYQVDAMRLDAKDTNTRAGHELRWAGLKGVITTAPDYHNLTLLYVEFAATDQLSQQASRKVNAVVTSLARDGSAFGEDYGTPQDAMLDIITANYGGRLPESIVDIAELSAQREAAMLRHDRFDYVADQRSTLWDALTMIGRSCRTVPSIVGGKLYFVRDEPRPTPIAVFSNNNILKGSFKIDRIMPGERTAAWIEAEYFDAKTWTWKKELVGLKPPDPAVLPLQVRFEGVTSRGQVLREATYQAACNVYRRQFVTFEAELDGFIPTLGDAITVSHDLPNWGQHGLIAGYTGNIVQANVGFEWVDTGNICAFRLADGTLSDQYPVTRGMDDAELVLTPYDDGETISYPSPPEGAQVLGFGLAPTHILFGTVDTWARKCLVLGARPRGMEKVELSAVLENEIVHSIDAFTPGLQTGKGDLTVPPGCTSASVSLLPATWGLTAQNVVYGSPAPGYPDQCYRKYPYGSGDGYPMPYYGGGAESTEFGSAPGDSFSITLAPVDPYMAVNETHVITGLTPGQVIHYRVGRGGDGATWENLNPEHCAGILEGVDGKSGTAGRLVVVFS